MGNVKKYIEMTKPGIVIVNLFTAFGGVVLASNGNIDFIKTFWVLLGTALVVASGCVLNNVLDIDIDSKMERTKNRVMVLGSVPKNYAVFFSIVLLLLSLLIIYFKVNLLSVAFALFGWFVYIVPYTLIFKRKNFWGIIVGAFSGAVPPLIGYCGITNNVDLAAILIFSILFVWQLPHSWAIVIRRLDDFVNANINALLNMKSLVSTKVLMSVTSYILIPLTCSLTYFNYAGKLYGFIALVTGVLFFLYCFYGFFTKDDSNWAKKVFIYSVNHLTILIIFLTIDKF